MPAVSVRYSASREASRVKRVTKPSETGDLPYRLRDDFLSPAEMTFYRALRSAVGDRVTVCTKVNLADVFFVVRPNENQSYRNRIDRKHVDFLLCDPATMRPLLGIELDDSSHRREARQERDRFVDEVFKAAKLPLGHVRVHASYDMADLSRWLSQYLGARSEAAAAAPTSPSPATTPSASGPVFSLTGDHSKCQRPRVSQVRGPDGPWGCQSWAPPGRAVLRVPQLSQVPRGHSPAKAREMRCV